MFGSNIHGDFLTQLERIHKLGGNLIQCFISNPAGKKTLKLTDENIHTMKTQLKKYNMSMIIHAPYVLNFAREFKLESWWIKTLQRELEYASKIGAKGSVIHFGKYLHLDKHVAITNMVSSLKYIIEHMPKDVVIYLETSCGQGSELGYTIEEFAEIYNQFTITEKSNIVVCIDTCHIFVAGYDIRNTDGIKKYLDTFDKLIGLQYVKLVHLNDSSKMLESHVDRHGHIGEGYIGEGGLKEFYKWAKEHNIDIILETGGENVEIPLLLKV